DRKAKTVVLRDLVSGCEKVEEYDKMILATGASPAPFTVPGAELPEVFRLWTLADMDALETKIACGTKKVAVVGGGFVGIELAESLEKRGLEVTLIQRGSHLLKNFDFEMSGLLSAELRRNGVAVELNVAVKEIVKKNDTLSILLSDGRSISTDVIVAGTGVCPNSELARHAGLDLGEYGHIITDEKLCTADQDIYAVGDVIEVNDPILGLNTAIALAGPANRQGRMAADNICGKQSCYHGTIGTSIIKVGSLGAGSVGYTEGKLRELGVPFQKIYLHPNSNASYYPGGAALHIKVLFQDDGKLLGAQVVGVKGVDKQIDIFAVAIGKNMKIQDLAQLELAYAPPFSSAKSPVNLAGMIGENIINGLSTNVNFEDLPEDAFLLDNRETAEYELGSLPGAVNIPMSVLRQRVAELPEARRIHIFCQSGLRGYIAERFLRQKGFDAVNLSGGYLTWKMFNCQSENSKHCQTKVVSCACETKNIDVRAMACPGPIVRLKQEMNLLKAGDSLGLLAPLSFESDLHAWLSSGGYVLAKLEPREDHLYALIQKCETVQCEQNTACKEPNAAIVLFSNDLDKAMAALIIACGMAASGMKTGIFFTFWGLSVLRKNPAPPVRKNLISKMFGWMLPKGAAKLKLSKMNMGGAGTAMMKQVMARENVATLPELLIKARELGVTFIACEMAMDVMGITREELIEIDDVAGVASFVEMGKGGNTLFI
ncbi:MAG: FAD-dependent oxidoreductase, partial [Victivallaceae bacterium]|nr:FAD-dependent oxidoreductase [Victivallaceae bacterium]